MKTALLSFISMILLVTAANCHESDVVKLPKPQTESGKPLMQCLKLRQTSRTFSSGDLSQQDMSNLLWAANGINRPESGKRTAPSAMNHQETDIYVITKTAAYLYDAKDHSLKTVLKEDIRTLAGTQDFVKTAPVNLVYVADFAKMGKASDEDKLLYGGADVGFIAQNVYLYCASQGLSVVVRGSVDKKALAAKLKLRPEQRIILAQTVGYQSR
jgi:SagB-type dehydrogenase family enzyme